VTSRTRPGRSRTLRYGTGASALVLLVCSLIGGLSATTLITVGSRVAGATARAHGEVIHAADRRVEVSWSAPGVRRTDTVALAVPAPPAGTRTDVAYNPSHPSTVFIPGSTELAAVDRAASGAAFSGLTTIAVLGAAARQVTSRHRLRRRPGQTRQVRRVRVQSGLLTRSWLELDSPPRWIPVHFDPILVTLPAPTSVQLHGDPERHRLIAADVEGIWLHPSGSVRIDEPRGRRIDSPSRPDSFPTAATYGWRRQLRADAGLLTLAPIIGLLWVFLDGGGALTWTCVTALTSSLTLWWAAVRGSDPS
jgi:hypothetical protein